MSTSSASRPGPPVIEHMLALAGCGVVSPCLVVSSLATSGLGAGLGSGLGSSGLGSGLGWPGLDQVPVSPGGQYSSSPL
jgi:hypothetical protein